MNIWANAVITTKGTNLLAKLIEGNTLKITRAVTGAGYVTPGLLQAQTEIIEPKQTLLLRKITYPEEGKCCLPCRLINDEVKTGYTVKQIGVFAMDPDEGEILFFIAQSPAENGTIVPAESEIAGYTAEWTFYFQYGQADNVTLMVDPTNVVVEQVMVEYVSEYVANEIKAATIPEIDAVTG